MNFSKRSRCARSISSWAATTTGAENLSRSGAEATWERGGEGGAAALSTLCIGSDAAAAHLKRQSARADAKVHEVLHRGSCAAVELKERKKTCCPLFEELASLEYNLYGPYGMLRAFSLFVVRGAVVVFSSSAPAR